MKPGMAFHLVDDRSFAYCIKAILLISPITLDKSKTPFTDPFTADTNEALVKKLYEHYRPPLELSVAAVDDGRELAESLLRMRNQKVFSTESTLHAMNNCPDYDMATWSLV